MPANPISLECDQEELHPGGFQATLKEKPRGRDWGLVRTSLRRSHSYVVIGMHWIDKARCLLLTPA